MYCSPLGRHYAAGCALSYGWKDRNTCVFTADGHENVNFFWYFALIISWWHPITHSLTHSCGHIRSVVNGHRDLLFWKKFNSLHAIVGRNESSGREWNKKPLLRLPQSLSKQKRAASIQKAAPYFLLNAFLRDLVCYEWIMHSKIDDFHMRFHNAKIVSIKIVLVFVLNM